MQVKRVLVNLFTLLAAIGFMYLMFYLLHTMKGWATLPTVFLALLGMLVSIVAFLESFR